MKIKLNLLERIDCLIARYETNYFFMLKQKLILSYEADNSRYFKTTEILKY